MLFGLGSGLGIYPRNVAGGFSPPPSIPSDFTLRSPDVSYDFTGGSLPAALTFTRSGNAWYFGTDGLLHVAGTDVPRFGTGGPGNTTLLGLLLECEARINYVPYSEDLTQWPTKSATMSVSKNIPDLFGNANGACTLTAGAANDTIETGALANSGAGRVSLWLKRVSGSGSIQVSTNGGTSYTTQVITTTETRYDFSCTTAANVKIRIVTSGNSITARGVMCETTAGADPSSYIPTNGAVVTRNAESCVNSNWSAIHNNTAGTLQVEVVRLHDTSNSVSYVASIDKGTSTVNISVTQSGTIPSAAIVNGGSTFNANGVLTLAAGSIGKMAVSYKNSASKAYFNSTEMLVSTQFDATPATDISQIATIGTSMTTLRLGNRQDGTRAYMGYFRKVNYWSGELTSAEGVATTYADGWTNKSGAVTANLASLSGSVAANFTGVSLETASIIDHGFFTAANTSLMGLFALLPDIFIRIGGNSQDVIPAPALTQNIANDLAAFLSGAGFAGKLAYGLDIPVNDSALAVTQAGYIMTAFPSTSLEFSLGNEPTLTDHYPTSPTVDWKPKFDSYRTALVAAYPSIKFVGPEDGASNVQTLVDSTAAGVTGFQTIASHFYAQSNTPTPTIPEVMAQVEAENWALNVSYASGNSGGVVVNEANINSKGGTKAITDRAVSPCWFVHACIKAAKAGMKGFRQHNVFVANDSTSYTHIGYYNAFTNLTVGGTTWYPTPIFYGLWAFRRMHGQQIAATTVGAGLGSNVVALATQRASGKANLLIVNNDKDNYAKVFPDQSSSWSTANTYLIQGTSVTDNSVTMNGSSIAASGASVPAAVSINNGDAVLMKPGAVLLVQFN